MGVSAATETCVCERCEEAHPLAEEHEIGEGSQAVLRVLCPGCVEAEWEDWYREQDARDEAARDAQVESKIMEMLGK